MKKIISATVALIIAFSLPVCASATSSSKSDKSVSSILLAFETWHNLTETWHNSGKNNYISQEDWIVSDALEPGYRIVRLKNWTVHYNAETLCADVILVNLTDNMNDAFGRADIVDNSCILFEAIEYGLPRFYSSEEYDMLEEELGEIYGSLQASISNATFPVFRANPVYFYESDCGIYSFYSVSKNGIAIQLELKG